jgi:hypothetical protein
MNYSSSSCVAGIVMPFHGVIIWCGFFCVSKPFEPAAGAAGDVFFLLPPLAAATVLYGSPREVHVIQLIA